VSLEPDLSPEELAVVLEAVPLHRRMHVLMAIYDVKGAEMAAIAACAREVLYEYMSNRVAWPEDVAIAIATHFQVPIAVLFGDRLGHARRRLTGWSEEQRLNHQRKLFGSHFHPKPLRVVTWQDEDDLCEAS
jgi:hypothetical protein